MGEVVFYDLESAAVLLVMGCLIAARPAFAKDDRVSFANDIVVDEGSTSGDLVCLMCSVKVHGEVHGDIVTLLGSVTVDDARSVSGDMAIVGGDASLGDNVSVSGDVAVIGGNLNRNSGASISGDTKVMAGRAWLFVPFAPLLIYRFCLAHCLAHKSQKVSFSHATVRPRILEGSMSKTESTW